MNFARWRAASSSLRWRLLAGTVVAMLAALLLAGVLLQQLFEAHVMQRARDDLVVQLDQVTARLEPGSDAAPRLDDAALSDPRWRRPFGGLYWQIEPLPGAPQFAPLRSRSLWDQRLQLPQDMPADGSVHVHELRGPRGEPLLVVERALRGEGAGAATLRVVVAGDLAQLQAAQARFGGTLAASLALLLLLMVLAALAQVRVGLAPLRALQAALARLRGGQAARLQGRFPAEVQPLVDDFNGVLDRHAELVTRARTQAGNLAHAVKTPLAILQQAAERLSAQLDRPGGATANDIAQWRREVDEQLALARRHIDWHLSRARAAAAHGLPGLRTQVRPVVDGLLRVMRQLHAERGLELHAPPAPGPDAAAVDFAGEAQDLQEMLGNLLDNACKWARRQVVVDVVVEVAVDVEVDAKAAGPVELPVAPPMSASAGSRPTPRLCIAVDDDGPGIAAEQRALALQRGQRLDEATPGSGLGLAIVHELARLYGGTLQLQASKLGGLRAELHLPALTSENGPQKEPQPRRAVAPAMKNPPSGGSKSASDSR